MISTSKLALSSVREPPPCQICWAQLYISLFNVSYRCAALPTPRGRQTLQTHQKSTFKRLRVISINSCTLRNQQSALSPETDFDRREGAGRQTLSFIPSHYIPESQRRPGAELTLCSCVCQRWFHPCCLFIAAHYWTSLIELCISCVNAMTFAAKAARSFVV